MTLTIEFELEADGRWIAEILELPGVMVYGATRDEALANVQPSTCDSPTSCRR
jgi:predicted RNase H-like HicB family nuclease